MESVVEETKKVVRLIEHIATTNEQTKAEYKQKRVVAYCSVSTKQEEQLNSYETQVNHYTEKINNNPEWQFCGIFADKGISGTSIKKRDEFNKMIRLCKKGKVDLIIVKSISRFARNTVDCLQHTRMLKDLGVDVFFEEQGIHSIEPGSEFYITICGTIAQSESENMSANIKWGKAKKAKEGKVSFQFKHFLGYREGENKQPEIDPEQAEIIKYIYKSFLMGDSLQTIAENLEKQQILTATGKIKWGRQSVKSILTNEKYIGDVIINKTYVTDCISKKIRKNNGQRAKYYVENNHPAIIDKMTFARVQEELARRNGKPRVTTRDTTTERGKYSSKYALSELLICGKCKTPYRRVVWLSGGKKKAMWRCINRLYHGKRYCPDSPAIDETLLQSAIMNAILKIAKQDINILDTLKEHIAKGLDYGEDDNSLNIEIEIAKIDAEFNKLIETVSADNAENFDEEKAKKLLMEKDKLKLQLTQIQDAKRKRESAKSRLEDIYLILDGLKNHPMKYDDKIVRQIIECVVVESKEKIKIIFVGGLSVEEQLG